MLVEILESLDAWIASENKDRKVAGAQKLPKVDIKVLGQTALLEASLSFDIVATMDVDLAEQLNFHIQEQLNKLLAEKGRHLDPVGHEAWMPSETCYQEIYRGRWVVGLIAEPVFVILSKAKVAPYKNRNLIIDYIASQDLDERLFDLAAQYEVDLEKVLK